MSSSLPFTVQDDIEAKEKYAAQQRDKNTRQCSSSRIRLWTLVIIASITTLFLVTYFGANNSNNIYYGLINEDTTIVSTEALSNNDMKENNANRLVHSTDDDKSQETYQGLTLKEELLKRIHDNTLIIFSKTYCPFSKKAKKILSSYNLKQALEVIEVDLRDDDYQVKMVLKEISDRETFPNIFLNGKTLGGSDDLERLHETGQLTELLSKNQLLIA